jgi:hypothetical protein
MHFHTLAKMSKASLIARDSFPRAHITMTPAMPGRTLKLLLLPPRFSYRSIHVNDNK